MRVLPWVNGAAGEAMLRYQRSSGPLLGRMGFYMAKEGSTGGDNSPDLLNRIQLHSAVTNCLKWPSSPPGFCSLPLGDS